MKNLPFLELAKVLMYDFHISYIKKKNDDRAIICLIESIYNKTSTKSTGKFVHMKEDHHHFDVRPYFARIH